MVIIIVTLLLNEVQRYIASNVACGTSEVGDGRNFGDGLG